ncbi:uncharacterized protein LOC117100877 [Anneissia japonica]|uniref:uncharacterized protein LOC117100877 n=1 Tax=Anneissia japonica TaxID=1529436 RepID=UPI001425ABEE|nr:uncharacterized protein LOC117100877 [Anneissia japonica]
MYLIDNESPTGSEFQETLEQDINGFLKDMQNTIPLTWYKFQHLLEEMGQQKIHVAYDEVCKLATQCGISKENLKHTLNYLHDLGIVMHFKQNRQLRDIVVLNPWKVNNITEKLITAVNANNKMIQIWNKLDYEGILEEQLIRYIWSEELAEDETTFKVFLNLMKQFGLLCEQIKNEKNASRSFFVPCRLKCSGEEMTCTPDNDQMVSIYIISDGFLLDTIFHRLVVKLIEMVKAKGYTTAPELFYNKATIKFGHHTLSLGQLIIDNKPCVKLEISVNGKPTDTGTGELSPIVCMQVLEYLKKELKTLTRGIKHPGYVLRVMCWSDLQDHFHDMEECLNNACIQCVKGFQETNKLQKLFKNMTCHVYLADNDLHSIKQGMGEDWKLLGVRLGLKWRRINQMLNCNRQPDCPIMDMLIEWRSIQKYETNQVEVMDKALKDHGLTCLADSLFASQRHVTSGEQSTVQTSHQIEREKDGYLADIDMLIIAKNLDNDWKSLGHILGFEYFELSQITSQFGPSIVEASLEMLVRWRDKQKANVNHLESIKCALTKFQHNALKEALKTYYQEKYNY